MENVILKHLQKINNKIEHDKELIRCIECKLEHPRSKMVGNRCLNCDNVMGDIIL